MSEFVPFEKYDGAGNDFVVVDADADPVADREAFARAHCDREAGVADEGSARYGADGVLFLALATDTSPATVTMTLVQPDGSIAEMCGNGARCVAAWAAERTGRDEFVIETPAGSRRACVDGQQVAVEMGTPDFDPEAVPLAGEKPLVDVTLDELAGTPADGMNVTALDAGVPHAVVFVDDVDDVNIDAVAPPIRHAGAFPEGANVTFASTDEDGFRQRTYERGVEGETRACGTGAVAVAAAAKRLGRLPESGGWVRVTPPGGELAVAVPDDGPARLRGPAVKEFEGELPASPDADRVADGPAGAALNARPSSEVEE